MKRILSYLLIWCFLVTSAAFAGPPRSIAINDCALSINGVSMASQGKDISTEKMESALGKPSRIEHGHRGGAAIYLWDASGLRAYPSGPSILSFGIFLSDADNVTSCPNKIYRGELLIDGIGISPSTNITFLNAHLKGRALKHTDTYGQSPVYSAKCGKGAIQIICSPQGTIETVEVFSKTPLR